jgi:hypothetical protein
LQRVESWNKPGRERTLFAVVLTTPNRGGSDDLYLSHLSHGPIGCPANLQSAGNA